MISTIIVRGTNKLRTIWINNIIPYVNIFLLKGFNVQFGKKCKITAMLTYRISRKAKVVIGDNFRLSGSSLINPLNKGLTSIAVSDNAVLKIGNNVGMSSPTIYIQDCLIVKDNVNLGGGVIVLDSDCHSLNYLDRRDGFADQQNKCCKGIVIEEDVLVGAYSIILKGVHIGARSIIGAGSVVTKDVPSDCIAAGNPCKVIRKITKKQEEK